MLGAHVIVAHAARLLLGDDEHALRALCKAVKKIHSSLPFRAPSAGRVSHNRSLCQRLADDLRAQLVALALADKLAPAENPMTPILSGFIFNSLAFARAKRMAL